jgi:hypothetical protein
MALGAAQRTSGYARMQDRFAVAAIQRRRVEGYADERPVEHSEGCVRWRCDGTVRCSICRIISKTFCVLMKLVRKVPDDILFVPRRAGANSDDDIFCLRAAVEENSRSKEKCPARHIQHWWRAAASEAADHTQPRLVPEPPKPATNHSLRMISKIAPGPSSASSAAPSCTVASTRCPGAWRAPHLRALGRCRGVADANRPDANPIVLIPLMQESRTPS